MRNILVATITAAVVAVSANLWGYWAGTVFELKATSQTRVELRALTETEKWRLFLFEESLRQGLGYAEFSLLRSIAKCESNWRQYRRDGSVVESNGNVGLAQINRIAHEGTYTKMNIDPENPYDNLKFMVYLYKRDGVAPWFAWSGHCWNK